MNLIEKRIDNLLKHISHVRENCEVIAYKLIEQGKNNLAIQLIANAQIHDNSKFYGIEWEFLHPEIKERNEEMFYMAVKQHVTNNQHHPEYWGSIHLMPSVYIAEMCSDWAARSSEFGNDIYQWIENKAFQKYNFDKDSDVYKEIQYYLGLLFEKAFV